MQDAGVASPHTHAYAHAYRQDAGVGGAVRRGITSALQIVHMQLLARVRTFARVSRRPWEQEVSMLEADDEPSDVAVASPCANL